MGNWLRALFVLSKSMLRLYSRNAALNWFLLLVSVAALGWLYFWPQPPGYAVAILGAAAVAMAFRKMTAIHKALSCAFAVALVFLEFHAIQIDRNMIETQHSADQSKLNGQLQKILKENRDGLAGILRDSQTKFNATMAEFGPLSKSAQSNLDLTKQNLENITGAGSFPYVWPMIKSTADVSLVVGNSGNYTLTGVEVHVTHTARDQHFQSVGTVPAQANRLLPFNIVPEVQPGSGLPDSYDIDITAQNGNYTEIIMFMPADAKIWPRTTPQIEGRKWQALVTLSKQVCKTNTFDGCRFVQLHDKNLDHFKNWAN